MKEKTQKRYLIEFLGFLVVIALIATFFVYYENRKQDEKDCENVCVYHPSPGEGFVESYGGFIAGENKYFLTKEQCIDYCLSNK